MCVHGCLVADGLATFCAAHLAVLRKLDDAILEWAQSSHAAEIAFPPLISVPALDRMDYFKNFPHLGFAAAAVRREAVTELASAGHALDRELPGMLLGAARFMLPSAACYPVYEHLEGTTLATPRYMTTLQRCFRNEDHYDGLARLRGFSMREIVAVGRRETVEHFLALHKQWIGHFAEGAGLPLSVHAATDPFFDKDGARSVMQRLFPVKEEFVFEDTVAVSSVNAHRNFFAERWNIRSGNGQHAYSGCVAFGLERWIHALTKRYADDCKEMTRAIGAGSTNARRHCEALRAQLQ